MKIDNMAKKLKVIGHILMAIPVLIMLIVAIASFYVYYKKFYPLTLATPITFCVIIGLWILGLFLTKNGKEKI